MELPKTKREYVARGVQFLARVPRLYASYTADRPYRLPPANVDVNITDRCNFSCTMCRGVEAGATYRPKPDLSAAAMQSIIDDMAAMRVTYLTLVGGEPLLRPDFVLDTVRAARARGIHIGITTNGWFLTEPLLASLARAGLHRIAFSLDGATPEAHDAVRAPWSFERVLERLEMCRRLKAEAGYNFRVHINTVAMHQNWTQLLAIAEIARRHGASWLVQPVDVAQVEVQAGSDPLACQDLRSLAIGPEELAGFEQQIRELLEFQKRDAVVANLDWQLRNMATYYRRLARLQAPERPRCYVGYNTIHVDSDGSFGSCIFMSPVASLDNTTLAAAWDSPAYTAHRRAIRQCRRPCSLNCYYPISLRMLGYNYGYLPVRRLLAGLRPSRPQSDAAGPGRPA